MKKTLTVLLAGFLAAASFFLPSCTKNESGSSAEVTLEKNAVEIQLNGAAAACDSSQVNIAADGTITIRGAGTYLLSGTLDEGSIVVDCVDAGSVDLLLKDAHITNKDGPCIHIKKAQKAILTLCDGTTNTLTDGTAYLLATPEETEPDGTIYSKEDLVLNGNGTLVVNAHYANGIVSKDALVIESGTIQINAPQHGVKGRDSIVVNGGVISIACLRDGLKSTNEENDSVGIVEINGGEIVIRAEDEAVQAVSRITFNGGSTTVESKNNGVKCDGVVQFNGGTVSIEADDVSLMTPSVEKKDACSVIIGGVPYSG